MSFSLIWGREGRATSKSSQERKKWDMAKMNTIFYEFIKELKNVKWIGKGDT